MPHQHSGRECGTVPRDQTRISSYFTRVLVAQCALRAHYCSHSRNSPPKAVGCEVVAACYHAQCQVPSLALA
jgi:hypothetical protein